MYVNRTISSLRVAATVGLLLWVARSFGGTAQPTTQPSTNNPHRSADACLHCHAGEGDRVHPIRSHDVDTMCLTCHDGEHARRERHPIGRSFASDQVTLPAGWPALDGKLGCATCHTLRHACSRPGTRPPATPAFVRDYDGVDLAGFCARCHVDDQTHHVFNPHAVQYVNDRVNESACGFCHLPGITEHERLSRSGRAHLRTGEPTLCLSCHRHHVDYFSPGHVGARVSPKIKAALTTSDEARNLPLAAGETVTCSTCHNPHQRGVFVESSVLARGGTTPERQTGALAMRGFGKTICGACHEP